MAGGTFGGGSGAELDPYLVEDLADLDAIRNDTTASYKLVNDIDAAETSTWYSGNGWVPIDGWIGILDGNGYKIDGLYVNRDIASGLFKETDSGGVIKNLGLENVDISGNNSYYNGAFVGRNYCDIYNCYSTGVINNPSGNDQGGIVGRNNYSTSEIKNCYSLCTVTGNNQVGGLVGRNDGIITNSYCAGNITGNFSVGGVVGINAGGSASDCYWDINVTGISSDAYSGSGTTGLTTSEMQNPINFSSWDTDIWFLENNEYPVLIIFIELFIDNLTLNPFYPWEGVTSNINLQGTLKELEDNVINVQYRLLLNGNHIYPPEPYPDTLALSGTEDIVPTMTDYTSPSGEVIESGNYNDNNEGYRAFNDNIDGSSSAWISANPVCWLGYHNTESKIVNKYRITSRDFSNADTISPKDWTFEGSNDGGTTWDVLHTVTDETGWTQQETREYTFDNEVSYSSFRINITSNNGHGTYSSIGELELFEYSGDIGFTLMNPTPQSIDINLDASLFNVGSNTLVMEVNSDELLSERQILSLTIIKEDRDTFTIERDLVYDGSHILTGDVILDSGNGITINGSGTGEAVIEIPTEGKYKIDSITVDADTESINTFDIEENMDNVTSLNGGLVFEKEIDTNDYEALNKITIDKLI